MCKQTAQDIQVLCDEPADQSLFLRLKRLNSVLDAIPDQNVRVYPSTFVGEQYKLIQPLMIDDRPDFIFSCQYKPLLVVELTEHGYTGDNPLQRFTRLAVAAENQVPVIYFGPFARVRDDELDLVDDPSTLSKRRVNTDLFRALCKLSQVYDVPVAVAEWITGSNGKPLKVPSGSDRNRLSDVFGHLVSRMSILLQYSLARLNSEPVTSFATDLEGISRELEAAFANPNTRGSQTKIELVPDATRRFVESPESILQTISPSAYFLKDKEVRLLAWLCIQYTRIQLVERGESTVAASEIGDLYSCLHSLKPGLANGCCFYYTGYKWRSDPHCGVLVNFDYLRARKRNEFTAEQRRMPLILYYPRIFLSPKSVNVRALAEEVSRVDKPGSEFHELFVQRYGSAEGSRRASKFLASSKGHIAQWKDTTKQSRIFRRYCDFIFLADAILLGNHLREQ